MRFVVVSMATLGLLLLSGNSFGRSQDFDIGMDALATGDYAEAYCLWRPLAEQGNSQAQYHLGWLYANGNGLAVDLDRALSYWRAAAEQGHADAQFAVGLAYTTGDGVTADLAHAGSWYLRAARQGHQDARDILMRLNGDDSMRLIEHHPELVYEPWFGWSARIKGERINVRGGPGTHHAIIAQLERGTEVRVIGSRGDWRMTHLGGAYEGDANAQAWIHKSLLSRIDR